MKCGFEGKKHDNLIVTESIRSDEEKNATWKWQVRGYLRTNMLLKIQLFIWSQVSCPLDSVPALTMVC